MPFEQNDANNIECPCCHGSGSLREYPPEPSFCASCGETYSVVTCCHCGGLGVIPPDMRSTNTNE